MPKRNEGHRQQELLAGVANSGLCKVTEAHDNPAEQAAYRRAAYGLQERGLLVLERRTIDGYSRLIARAASEES